MKENSIYVDSLISNFKKKKYWIECIDINNREGCWGMFESATRVRLRCPNCLIENKKEKGKRREWKKAGLLKKKKVKKPRIKQITKRRCLDVKKNPKCIKLFSYKNERQVRCPGCSKLRTKEMRREHNRVR